MPELAPNPQGSVLTRLQIPAQSGLALYGQIVKTDGTIYNTASRSYEASTPSNWSAYVVTLKEVIQGSGVYFGDPPTSLPDFQTKLFPVYQQAGDAPASTDGYYFPDAGRDPLVYVLEFNSYSALLSVGRFRPPLPGMGLSLPSRQDSAAVAQEILNQLYAARLQLAKQRLASVTIDGETTVFTRAQDLDQQIQFWERKVAVLTGRRRRTSTLRMDHWG